MYLEIITPDKKVFEGDIKSIIVPGSQGSFGILTNHAPIISTLAKGVIKIVDSKQNTQLFKVNGGVIEVLHNRISILAESV